jgi:micrococcal nuclease
MLRSPEDLYYYKAKVTGAWDGDSMTLDIDLGLGAALIKQKLRLHGVDTPELRDPDPEMKKKAQAARDFTRELVLDKDVIIKTHKDKEGKYGRWIAEVFVDGMSLNEQLVKQGHAVRKDYS